MSLSCGATVLQSLRHCVYLFILQKKKKRIRKSKARDNKANYHLNSILISRVYIYNLCR